jgi:hypothetical protein
MFRRSFPVLLKWMRHISEVNGKTNEKPCVIKDPNEVEVQRNNRYSESFVVMVRSGLKWLMMSALKLFNHLSQRKFQPVQPSVLIPGKPIPE